MKTFKEESFYIKNKKGENIACTLHNPDKYNKKFVVICHGFGSSKTGSHGNFVLLARSLSDLGYKVLRFDFPCNGDSEGKFEDNDFQDWTETLISVVRDKKFNYDKLILIGNSMGGASVIHTQAKYKIADLVISWVPGIAFAKKEDTNTKIIEINGEKYAEERGMRVKTGFWKFIQGIDFKKELESISVPGLMIFSKQPAPKGAGVTNLKVV